jgi:hypothetical protein
MQAFSSRAILFAKLGLLAFVATAVAAVFAFRWGTGLPHGRNSALAQPIPFSHKHHVGDDGIDCRYCHSTVETARSAGLPSTQTCLNCHSQLFADAPILAPLRESMAQGRSLQWNRVHQLPDFVYFDHSIHVRQGVSCGECHGPVDRMPLTWRKADLQMRWCLDCHREPASHLHSPADTISTSEVSDLSPSAQRAALTARGIPNRRRLTDCSTCHR